LLHSDISKIISGCKTIVAEYENKLYDRNFRLTHFSSSYLSLLSLKDNIDIRRNNDEDEDGFLARDVKNWLPEGLQNINSRIIRRNLTVLQNNNYLKRDRVEKTKKGPGRPKKNDITQIYTSRDPKSFYTYSASPYLVSLERLVLGFVPRAIIYTILRQSGVLERFLKICEYKKLLEIKNTEMNEMIKRLRTQTKTIGPIPESAFSEDKYVEVQGKLMGINRKKMLMSIASEKAKLLVKELDWDDRIYTRFFVAGGFTPHS
jgi:hypothetical protein